MARVSIFGALLLLLLFASLATREARAQELLVNGGFEQGVDSTGRPIGWTANTDTILIPIQYPVFAGINAGRLSAEQGPSARAFQDIPFRAGATYHLSAELAVTGNSQSTARVKIERAGPITGTEGFSSLPLAGSGGSYRFRETPDVFIPCDATRVTVIVELVRETPSVYAYVDDLTLATIGSPQPCPTPTRPPPPSTTQPSPGSTPAPPTDAPGGPGGGGGGDPTTAPPLPHTSLLVNGGFEVAEAGRPRGWRTQGGVLGQVASPVHGGRFAAVFASASESTKWAYQTVLLTPLAWYELEGYVLLDDAQVEGALLRLSWYASTDGSGSALANVDSTEELVTHAGSYTHLTTGAVQAPPGSRSAKARILLRPRSTSGGVIYIDDVALWESAPGSAPGDAPGASGRGSSRSGGRASSSMPGGIGAGGGSFSKQPTPVVRRSERLETELLEADSNASWWPWALVAGPVVLVGAGYGVYRRRRR
jgi:hypothetical protein